jgi:hypothetical protein
MKFGTTHCLFKVNPAIIFLIMRTPCMDSRRFLPIVLTSFWKNWRLGQRLGLQNTTLTSYYYKNIYRIVMYVYFYESSF